VNHVETFFMGFSRDYGGFFSHFDNGESRGMRIFEVDVPPRLRGGTADDRDSARYQAGLEWPQL
jgi:hypothetical protein